MSATATQESLDGYTIQFLPKMERGLGHLFKAIRKIATDTAALVKDVTGSIFKSKAQAHDAHDAHDAHGGHDDHAGGHGHEADFLSEVRSGLGDIITTPFTMIGDIIRVGRQTIAGIWKA